MTAPSERSDLTPDKLDLDAIRAKVWYKRSDRLDVDVKALLDLVSRLREQVEQLKDEKNALRSERDMWQNTAEAFSHVDPSPYAVGYVEPGGSGV